MSSICAKKFLAYSTYCTTEKWQPKKRTPTGLNSAPDIRSPYAWPIAKWELFEYVAFDLNSGVQAASPAKAFHLVV